MKNQNGQEKRIPGQHAPPDCKYPRAACTPAPALPAPNCPLLSVKGKLGFSPYDTEDRKIWFARGRMSGPGGCCGSGHLSTFPMHPYPMTPSHPTTLRNSPSRQAQEVQKRKADPGAQRDRGYLLDRNHLRNMPYFKPVHVSRLSRCPVQGARRGQSGSRGVRTLALTLARAHTRPRSASPAAVGVCVHAARGGGTCAPAPSLAARAQFERSLGSTPHLVAPARAALQ